MNFLEEEDNDLFEDDIEILIDHGFPRRVMQRSLHFENMDDFTFFKRFRLYKQTVLNILIQIEDALEFPTNVNNSVSPINQLLLTLRFYATGAHQSCVADFVGVHTSTACRIIKKVSEVICNRLIYTIRMPTPREFIREQAKFFEIARFPRIVGVVDGTHIRLQSPGGNDPEIFRNRKGYFSINAQVTCSADMKIIDLVARWPGSSHDATVFMNSNLRARFENGEFGESILIGDAGYPLRRYFLTPLGQPTTPPENRYNRSFNRTRNIVERTIGIWKRRFPCLAYGLRLKINNVLLVIVATAVLHNFAREMNEPEPPLLDELTVAEMDYLIEQGNIPEIVHDIHLPDVRTNLNNFFL